MRGLSLRLGRSRSIGAVRLTTFEVGGETVVGDVRGDAVVELDAPDIDCAAVRAALPAISRE